MRRLIAITHVTLDGVMQSPGGPEEDPRNGFTHGGWVMHYWDDALSQAIDETIAEHARSREGLEQELGDRVRASAHFREGVAAFREKRTPRYE